MSKAVQAPKKSGRGAPTTYYQCQSMVEWLEVPQNFAVIVGDALKTVQGVVAGAKLKKTHGYSSMAGYVNERNSTNWDVKIGEARYRAFLTKYKETKSKIASGCHEKYCLGLEDFKKGIDTIEKKIQADCFFFERMDLLFGSRQNVIH